MEPLFLLKQIHFREDVRDKLADIFWMFLVCGTSASVMFQRHAKDQLAFGILFQALALKGMLASTVL